MLVHDVDEYLIPINWNINTKARWCKADEPTMVSLVLQSMLTTARHRVLYNYKAMNQSSQVWLTTSRECKVGYSTQNIWPQGDVCHPVSSFILPERVWMNVKGSDKVLDLPVARGRFHSIQPEDSLVEKLTQAQEWKSFHYVTHTPVLEGTCTYHYNSPFKAAGSVLAPRDYHKEGMSFEIAHVKPTCARSDCVPLLVSDTLLKQLNELSFECKS